MSTYAYTGFKKMSDMRKKLLQGKEKEKGNRNWKMFDVNNFYLLI